MPVMKILLDTELSAFTLARELLGSLAALLLLRCGFVSMWLLKISGDEREDDEQLWGWRRAQMEWIFIHARELVPRRRNLAASSQCGPRLMEHIEWLG